MTPGDGGRDPEGVGEVGEEHQPGTVPKVPVATDPRP